MAKERLGKLALEIEVDRSKLRTSLQQAKGDAQQAVKEISKSSRLNIQGGSDLGGGSDVSRDSIAARAEAMRVSEMRRRRDAQEKYEARRMLEAQGMQFGRGGAETISAALSRRFGGASGLAGSLGGASAMIAAGMSLSQAAAIGRETQRQTAFANTGAFSDASRIASLSGIIGNAERGRQGPMSWLGRIPGGYGVDYMANLKRQEEAGQTLINASNASGNIANQVAIARAQMTGTKAAAIAERNDQARREQQFELDKARKASDEIARQRRESRNTFTREFGSTPSSAQASAARGTIIRAEAMMEESDRQRGMELALARRDDSLSREAYYGSVAAEDSRKTAAKERLKYNSRGAFMAQMRMSGSELQASIAGSLQGKTGAEYERARVMGISRLETFREESKLSARDYVLSTPYAQSMSTVQAAGAITASQFMGANSRGMQSDVIKTLESIDKGIQQLLTKEAGNLSPIPPESRN